MNNNQLRHELIDYISQYLLKRHIKMKQFLKSIKVQLIEGNLLTNNQFKVILKWIANEPKFKNKPIDEIYKYFRPIIRGYRPDTKSESKTVSLDEFFQ